MLRKVIEAAHMYEGKTGHAANALYVGRDEWNKLRLEAQEHFCFDINGAHEDDRRLECGGLLVFVVNAESHLNVCAINP